MSSSPRHVLRITLSGVSGPGAGVETTLGPGANVTVGRTDRAGLVVATDSFLSGVHFEVACSSTGAVVRDLGSRNGVFFRSQRVLEQRLVDGDRFTAGGSEFLVRIEDSESYQAGQTSHAQTSQASRLNEAAHASQLSPISQTMLSVPILRTLPQVTILSSLGEPLYAVLDSARDPAIIELLRDSAARYFSLYHGQSAVELESVAPYLVYLPPGNELLPKLIEAGWGKSWGIFVASGLPMEDIWKQLRRSLMVTVNGAQHYFRFYDPRVLRVFLRTVDGGQWDEFSGQIRFFLTESEDGKSMMRYFTYGYGAGSDEVPVVSTAP